MIDTALTYVLDELNGYLAARFPGREKMAVMASLTRPDGGAPLEIDNKLILSLVNIENEARLASTGFVARERDGRGDTSVRLNLYVMLAASYAGNYGQALNMLGQAMAFFRARPHLDAQGSGTFPASMLQLNMELVSLSMSELHTVWATLGSNYLPSAVYKLRTVMQDLPPAGPAVPRA